MIQKFTVLRIVFISENFTSTEIDKHDDDCCEKSPLFFYIFVKGGGGGCIKI